jgi:protein required for attachment to host cells
MVSFYRRAWLKGKVALVTGAATAATPAGEARRAGNVPCVTQCMLPMWIVVADSSACRLFEVSEPAGPLQELEVLSHPEGRLREQDLVSDLPGRTFDSQGAGRHAKEAEVGPKKHEAIVFAGRIADRLEAGRVRNTFDKLALIAPPEFLGLLRDKLSPQLRALMLHEVDKNVSRLDPAAIRARLPERLF